MRYYLREGIRIDSFSDGEMVAYDQNNETIHVLNAMGALVLRVLFMDDGIPLDSFVNAVLAFDPEISRGNLEKDYNNMLNDLLRANIITDR